jgi:hypothetical protein
MFPCRSNIAANQPLGNAIPSTVAADLAEGTYFKQYRMLPFIGIGTRAEKIILEWIVRDQVTDVRLAGFEDTFHSVAVSGLRQWDSIPTQY